MKKVREKCRQHKQRTCIPTNMQILRTSDIKMECTKSIIDDFHKLFIE